MHDRIFTKWLDTKARRNGDYFVEEFQRIAEEVGEKLTEADLVQIRKGAQEATRINAIRSRNNQL